MNNSQVGDPGTYLPGAQDTQPSSILSSQGGPCTGGYAGNRNATPFTGELPAIVSPDNPYFDTPPVTPTGPSVVASAEHVVATGNDLTESSTIGITDATERSLLSSKSFDFSLTGIYKQEVEASAGGSAKLEVQVSAGLDAGWSQSAGVTETLANGSELSAIMGNIPYTPADVGSWLGQEGYSWRRFLCKAQLGPKGLGQQVWVQGYTVDGYHGSGGITDLGPAQVTSPRSSTVVLADPAAEPDFDGLRCTVTERPGSNRFRWSHPVGTMSGYEVQLEDVSSGLSQRHQVAFLGDSGRLQQHGRPGCGRPPDGSAQEA